MDNMDAITYMDYMVEIFNSGLYGLHCPYRLYDDIVHKDHNHMYHIYLSRCSYRL